MIDLNLLLKFNEITNLGYDSLYLEKPVPNIINFEWKNILKPPPTNTSKETISELQIISLATLNRTNKDIDLVIGIDQDPDAYFIDLTNKYDLRYPTNSIQQFYKIIKPILLNIKGMWNRPRPAQLAKYYNIPIEVLVSDTHHTASYPSGHTVYTSLVSMILNHIYPIIDQKKLDIIVKNTAKARVLQGVHFPSDNAASIKLTKFLFNKLKNNIL